MNASSNSNMALQADKHIVQGLISQIKSKYQYKQENFHAKLLFSVNLDDEQRKMTEGFQKSILLYNQHLASKMLKSLKLFKELRNKKYQRNIEAASNHNIQLKIKGFQVLVQHAQSKTKFREIELKFATERNRKMKLVIMAALDLYRAGSQRK